MDAITREFGGLAKLGAELVKTGTGHFGSGWVWLAAEGDKLTVLATHDAEDTLTQRGLTPLLTCDLWEHAYYLKYQNKRADYLKAWWNVVNWKAVAELFAKA